jgi:cytoskeletal protein CcmA (bactofilin family)
MALFGSNKEKNGGNSTTTTAQNLTADSGLTCVIAKGTVIEGILKSSENMRIDGLIRGDVRCEKKLIMDATGEVLGNVYAGESVIKGKVEGSVNIETTLHLLESSFIKGDIKAKKLHVEEGARYDGKCLIG